MLEEDDESDSMEEEKESKIPKKTAVQPVVAKHVAMKGTISDYANMADQMAKPPQPASSVLKDQYAPLEWSVFFDSVEMVNNVVPLYKAGTGGHMFVCLHGAGHSAMSFAALAEKMKKESTVFAFDFRGHGKHVVDNETDLSVDTLIGDTINVLNHVLATNPGRSINLVGHSMGGSIATKTADKIVSQMKDSELAKALVSLFIIDVVEGTAMDALPFMEQIVQQRPVHFKDLEAVVRYGIQCGQVRDRRSARVSMPA